MFLISTPSAFFIASFCLTLSQVNAIDLSVTSASQTSSIERAIFVLTNGARVNSQQFVASFGDSSSKAKSCGLSNQTPLPPLQYNVQLTQAAKSYSSFLSTSTCFDHNCQGDWAARVEATFTASKTIAENIATGFPDALSLMVNAI